MFREKKVLAIVPARGGSKGIPKKNIQPLAGKPLIAHTAELIGNINWIDRTIVSTDSDEIASVAETYGLDAPFRRPEALSDDQIGDFEVLEHALTTMEELDQTQYDIILMLQPTSPCRTAEHIFQCLEKLVNEKRDTVWTVSPVDLKVHPLKQLCPTEDGGMKLWSEDGRKIIARQQLGESFIRNGAVYAFTRSCLMEQRSIYGNSMGYVVIQEPLANIDTPDDLKNAENLL
jgi:CMP-N,N'-diacetyllegionaminic acid synthase